VLESERGAADDAERVLTEAGHTVLRCHERGAPAFPCLGVEDQSACPLRSHQVDVALTVRSRPRSQPAPQEDGVRCALMHRVPLVVAGPAVLDPYEQFEAVVVERAEDVVATCEQVAEAELARHSRIATDALTSFGPGGDRGAGSAASVTRREGQLHVAIAGLDGLAPRERDAAVVRMIAKLREYDPSARGIDVSVAAAH